MAFKSDAHRRWWFAVGQYEDQEFERDERESRQRDPIMEPKGTVNGFKSDDSLDDSHR